MLRLESEWPIRCRRARTGNPCCEVDLGSFFDLASSEAGNAVSSSTNYPFGSSTLKFGTHFPLTPDDAAPPPIEPPSASSGVLFSVDPNLELPYTLQWNVALEQALGTQQTVSASYIGAREDASSRLQTFPPESELS